VTEALGGALGGLFVLVLVAVGVEVAWRRQERKIDRILSELSHLK
jgi:HAMP domain-containing protein